MAEVAQPREGQRDYACTRAGSRMEEARRADRGRMGAGRSGRREGAGGLPRRGDGSAGKKLARPCTKSALPRRSKHSIYGEIRARRCAQSSIAALRLRRDADLAIVLERAGMEF